MTTELIVEDQPILSEVEQEQLVQEMLAAQNSAEVAPEPGNFKTSDVIHKGDGDVPAPMVAHALESAGYVYVYGTKDRERSIINRNMLPAILRKTMDDGSRAFTLTPPKDGPRRGTIKCKLHADSPDRAYYDSMGFDTCVKANLPSPFMAQMHMERRHKVEWKTMENERLTAERLDDKEFQRTLLTKASEMGAASLYELSPQEKKDLFRLQCTICSTVFHAKSRAAVGNKHAAHVRKKHTEHAGAISVKEFAKED
jgi:hypothetical protein